jgi:hypothetical protein
MSAATLKSIRVEYYLPRLSGDNKVCFEPTVWPDTGARTDTTQQSGQTADKEVEIKNITVYVSGYTETDTTGMLSPPNAWSFSLAADINSNVFYFYFLIWSLS